MGNQTEKAKHCCLPAIYGRQTELEALEKFDPLRSFAIFGLDQTWVKGTVLKYYFFDKDTDTGYLKDQHGQQHIVSWVGAPSQQNIVRKAFSTWKAVGIDLDFVEVNDRNQASIKIGFMEGDGSWSAVGTDCLIAQYKDPNARTMNFGWDLTNDFDTALHEIGHALGMHHAHQNKNSGITWNEPGVIKYFKGHPNYWDEAQIRSNILDPLEVGNYKASVWDRDSCMQYPFEKGCIKEPTEYMTQPLIPGGGLSDLDKEWLRRTYPISEVKQERTPIHVLQSERLNIEHGDQANFPINVDETREYNIQLSGESDAVMVLRENTHAGWKQVAASNDSGTDSNAKIRMTLNKGTQYNLVIRLYWEGRNGETIVTLW